MPLVNRKTNVKVSKKPSFLLFYLNSYLLTIDHYPKQVEKLAKLISKDASSLKNKANFPIVENVNNMLKKFGYMILAKDSLSFENITPIPSIWHDFTFNNFVYDSKAFLDSVAITLKFSYDIDGSKGGDIDLGKDKFLNKIGVKDSEVGKKIKKQSKWINEVIEWRTALIHRLTTGVMPTFPGKPTDEVWKKVKNEVNIPMEPVSMFSITKESKRLEKKYGKVMQPAIPFCEQWISNGEILLELACKSLENKII